MLESLNAFIQMNRAPTQWILKEPRVKVVLWLELHCTVHESEVLLLPKDTSKIIVARLDRVSANDSSMVDVVEYMKYLLPHYSEWRVHCSQSQSSRRGTCKSWLYVGNYRSKRYRHAR